MGFRTWWLESKHSRIERKLHHLRGLQKIAREKKDEAQLERLTHDINTLVAQEQAVKADLRAAS